MYDAIILGLGGVGSMALRGLARQGRGGRFLGIERFPLLHSYGSSHGKTRIYRRAYFEHCNYVPWIEESIRVFREMEQEHQASFVQECGTIIIEPSQSPTSSDPEGFPQYCRASYESAREHGIPVEFIDAPTLKERYPQFNLADRDDMVGMLEPSGGFVRCEKVMKAAFEEAKAAPHVDILEDAQVISLDYLPSNDVNPIIELRVQTADQDEPIVIATKCLLVSMGAWTGQLFPSWAPHLRPLRQFQAFFSVQDNHPELYGYHNMPTWVMIRPDYPLPHYGVPCDVNDPDSADCRHWLKIGIHGRDDYIADPSTNPRHVSEDERREVLDAAQKFINLDQTSRQGPLTPDNALAQIMPCIYTMTKDSHFMLGTPRGHDQVFCVAGLSGHGYKQSPALGQMMVDYALGNDMSKWGLGFCDPRRFGV